jgi:hypothetical protein
MRSPGVSAPRIPIGRSGSPRVPNPIRAGT